MIWVVVCISRYSCYLGRIFFIFFSETPVLLNVFSLNFMFSSSLLLPLWRFLFYILWRFYRFLTGSPFGRLIFDRMDAFFYFLLVKGSFWRLVFRVLKVRLFSNDRAGGLDDIYIFLITSPLFHIRCATFPFSSVIFP